MRNLLSHSLSGLHLRDGTQPIPTYKFTEQTPKITVLSHFTECVTVFYDKLKDIHSHVSVVSLLKT